MFHIIQQKNTITYTACWGTDYKKYIKLKVHIFWGGHKILQNFHLTFVLCSASQSYAGDFAKFYGFLRIYEIY